jgi:hypothetical protein
MTPRSSPSVPTPARSPGELVVDLPSPRRPVTVGVLAFWLVGWAFGLTFMVQQLASPGPFSLDRAFLLAWMLLWGAAGLGVIAYLAWLLAGRERVLLERDALAIRRGVWGIWWTRRWPLDSIHKLRTFGREISPVIAFGLDMAGRGASGVRFESGGHVVRFARTLSEHDARAIVDMLRARHAFGAAPPHDESGRHDSHSAA